MAPGMFIFPGVSTSPGTLELKELSLAIKSPQGVILIVGCSHPGVEHIVQEATAIDPHINILFGGLHQIQKPDLEVKRIAAVLHDQVQAGTRGAGTLYRRTGVRSPEESIWRPLRVRGAWDQSLTSRARQ